MNRFGSKADFRSAAWTLLFLGTAPACSKARTPPEPSVASAEASAARAPVATAPQVASGAAVQSAPASTGGDPCTTVCERSRELACTGPHECTKACADMVSTPICKEQLLAALRCFVKHPATAWECGEDGLASIKDGFCNAEQARFVQCIESMPDP